MNRRLYGGMTIFERGSSAIRDCIKALRSGGVMAILPDVRMKTQDLSVPFLGGMANVGRGMAAFARKTNSPIVVAKLRRDGLTRHEFALSDPIVPDPSLPAEEDILRMTTIVLAGIDKRIREEPEQWFWYNKRWVLDPV
jgi:KDO2-lipid IV(A) lauroyltransferase